MKFAQLDAEGDMPIEPLVVFHRVPPSSDLLWQIRQRALDLGKYYRSLLGCHVVVEQPERRRETGNRYHVRITLTVPGEEIVVNHRPSLRSVARVWALPRVTKRTEAELSHTSMDLAVHDAFDAARRRLQDYARRRRGAVKRHSAVARRHRLSEARSAGSW